MERPSIEFCVAIFKPNASLPEIRVQPPNLTGFTVYSDTVYCGQKTMTPLPSSPGQTFSRRIAEKDR